MTKEKILYCGASLLLALVLTVSGFALFNREQAKADSPKPIPGQKLSPELNKKLNDAIKKHDQIIAEANQDLEAEVLEVYIVGKFDRRTQALRPNQDGTWDVVRKADQLPATSSTLKEPVK